MAHVSRKLSNSVEGALAAGGDPATSPVYVLGPFLKLIVIGGVAAITFGAIVEEIEQLRVEAEAEASRYLEDIAADLRAEGIETHVLVTGSRPAETIIHVAEEEDVDVIMLSSHGRGEFDNLSVGSVAARVVQQTSRPVLLVPIQERRTPQS